MGIYVGVGMGIKKTFFQVHHKPAGTLSLVELLSGRLAILRDGQLVGDLHWDASELDQGVQAFRQVNMRLKQEAREITAEHK